MSFGHLGGMGRGFGRLGASLGGALSPPAGFVFLYDDDGTTILTDDDGTTYLVEEI